MNGLNPFCLIWALLYVVLIVNASDNWCPCLRDNDPNNQTIHEITAQQCEKYKGLLFSEKREFKCECCLILRQYNQKCKQPKNKGFVVECEDGLVCNHKHVCKVEEEEGSDYTIDTPGPDDEISPSFGKDFAEILKSLLDCDCLNTQCNDDNTRMQCEKHQGLFVDRLSVRKTCQCCDRCYIAKGQHEQCSNHQKGSVRYVCDTGLYCSPFTHMCIEKREILTQFLKRIKKNNSFSKRVVYIGDESYPDQNI